MQNRSTFRRWIFASLALLSVNPVLARDDSDSKRRVREEIHKTYPLDAHGSIRLDNVNGDVTITTWDKESVKLDVVKRAETREDLERVKIDVSSKPGRLEIRTKYPRHEDDDHDNNNTTAVEYTLVVPKGVALDKVSTVNGAVELSGLEGSVKVSTVNGRINASSLRGDAKLSAVNGKVTARFASLGRKQDVSVSAVNGAVTVLLPDDAGASVDISTVNGTITNEFGPARIEGHRASLKTNIGEGEAAVRLSTVNGPIALRKLAREDTDTEGKEHRGSKTE